MFVTYHKFPEMQFCMLFEWRAGGPSILTNIVNAVKKMRFQVLDCIVKAGQLLFVESMGRKNVVSKISLEVSSSVASSQVRVGQVASSGGHL